MGLDMYLSKKTYVKQWEHQDESERFDVTVKKGSEIYPFIRPERIIYVQEEVAYWRKANQIHGWFVNNTEEIQADVKYYVTRENLEDLLEVCKKVVSIMEKLPKKKVQVESGWSGDKTIYEEVEVYDDVEEITDLLPPTQGFFFGSYEIGDWYKQDVERTIKVLEDELTTTPGGYGSEYEYYASW